MTPRFPPLHPFEQRVREHRRAQRAELSGARGKRLRRVPVIATVEDFLALVLWEPEGGIIGSAAGRALAGMVNA